MYATGHSGQNHYLADLSPFDLKENRECSNGCGAYKLAGNRRFSHRPKRFLQELCTSRRVTGTSWGKF